MQSTMQDAPLQIAQILRHGSTVHGDAEVVTWTGCLLYTSDAADE